MPFFESQLLKGGQASGFGRNQAPTVDKQGRTVAFLLSKRRDVAAAKRFFSRAAKQHGVPRVITLDGYAASHRGGR
jgi:hypothetical protein